MSQFSRSQAMSLNMCPSRPNVLSSPLDQSVEYTTPPGRTAASKSAGLELCEQQILLCRTHPALKTTLGRTVQKGFLIRAKQPRVFKQIRPEIDHLKQIRLFNPVSNPEINLTGAMAAPATQRQNFAVRSTTSIGKSTESGSRAASTEEI